MEFSRKAPVLSLVLFFLLTLGLGAEEIQFVFTSDPHFGITRAHFQGSDQVDAAVVNRALVAKINALSAVVIPNDGGLHAGKAVGPVDFLIEGGDIANREEGEGAKAIQSASLSWAQFKSVYLDGLTLQGKTGPTQILLLPGNHDITNALGSYKVMTPPQDPTAFLAIYNAMMKPVKPLTAQSLDLKKDQVNYSLDAGGVHFVVVQMWPDPAVRAWIEADLAKVAPATPVLLFTHGNPSLESKYFTNPNGKHDMNTKDKFENVVGQVFVSGTKVDEPSIKEQKELALFFQKHRNIAAYFHGHVHLNQFYDWVGPDKNVAVPVVSVDSPMKGLVSSENEKKLSFQLVSLDKDAGLLTVREVYWNPDPANPQAPVAFGSSETLALNR